MARPIIGIALGGGAARGWAHIGVLKTLIDAGLEPDIVAGTSIGAVAGACYVTGRLQALEDFAAALTPRRVFGFLDINFAGSGLITGQRLSSRLENHLQDVTIEGLERKFVAVATELGTGHEVWLNKGSLVNALQASFALPGIFRPVKINGRWLIDGALVNPVPVSVCRALGARIVIAVNLSSDSVNKGSVIHDQEILAELSMPPEEAKAPGQEWPRRHSSVASADLRQERRRARHIGGDDGRDQHHPGPHRPLAACRRPAGHHHLAKGGQHRPVRFPPRRRSHDARRQGRRKAD